MFGKENNYAFIDSQNLNLAIRDQGWRLDWRRFRIYLQEKYHVQKAYVFVGYLSANEKLYQALRTYGYELVFKPIVMYDGGKVKGNVDAELVLHAMIEYERYDQAVIVTGDGDFYCLVKYLLEQNKLSRMVIPNKYQYSILLRRILRVGVITFLNDLRARLEYKNPGLRRDSVGGST